jgi:hypothetical protein
MCKLSASYFALPGFFFHCSYFWPCLLVKKVCMSGGVKVMFPEFFLENVIAITLKFTWMIHIYLQL